MAYDVRQRPVLVHYAPPEPPPQRHRSERLVLVAGSFAVLTAIGSAAVTGAWTGFSLLAAPVEAEWSATGAPPHGIPPAGQLDGGILPGLGPSDTGTPVRRVPAEISGSGPLLRPAGQLAARATGGGEDRGGIVRQANAPMSAGLVTARTELLRTSRTSAGAEPSGSGATSPAAPADAGAPATVQQPAQDPPSVPSADTGTPAPARDQPRHGRQDHTRSDHATKDDGKKDHATKDDGQKDDGKKDHPRGVHATKDGGKQDGARSDHLGKDDSKRDPGTSDHAKKGDSKPDHPKGDHPKGDHAKKGDSKPDHGKLGQAKYVDGERDHSKGGHATKDDRKRDRGEPEQAEPHHGDRDRRGTGGSAPEPAPGRAPATATASAGGNLSECGAATP